jgi:hypothetical protein
VTYDLLLSRVTFDDYKSPLISINLGSYLGRLKRFAVNKSRPEANIMRSYRFDMFASVAKTRYSMFSVNSRSDSNEDLSNSDSEVEEDPDDFTNNVPDVFATKFKRAGMWRHRGVSFKPYTDNTNFRTYNETTLSLPAAVELARILAVPSVGRVARTIRGVVVDGQKRGAECDAAVGRALSRCGKPRSRAGVIALSSLTLYNLRCPVLGW